MVKGPEDGRDSRPANPGACGRDSRPANPGVGDGGCAGRASLPERKWLSHAIPLRISQYVGNPIFFITVCVNRHLHGRDSRPANPNAGGSGCSGRASLPYADVLAAIRFYHEKGKWLIHFAVVMPDHVHFLVQFPSGADMVKLFQNWKAYLARKFGIDWQLGMFEHRIRSDGEFAEKLQYCRQNPVAWGLVCTADEWPYQFNGRSDGRDSRPANPGVVDGGCAGRASLPRGSMTTDGRDSRPANPNACGIVTARGKP